MQKLFTFTAIIITAPISIAFGYQQVDLRFIDSASVNDTVIRLGDIARIKGDNHTLVQRLKKVAVGQAAPPGYSRLVNSADAVGYFLKPQFESIHFNTVREYRTRVRTCHQTVTIADYRQEIEEYLSKNLHWQAGEWSCELEEKSIRCLDKPLRVKVEGVENPLARGPVQLTLRVIQQGSVRKISFTCRITVTAGVVVAARPIRREQIITAADLRVQPVDITRMRYDPFRDMSSVIGRRSARTVGEGCLLNSMMIKEDHMVKKGDQVYIHLATDAIRISMPARAREAGHQGESIWVENLQTHKLVRVEVAGKGQVIMPMGGAL